jgi:hypothetical protein
MVETVTPKKTKTKRKTTTIAAMIVLATIIAFPIAANKLAFAAVATTTPTAGPTILKLAANSSPVVIPLLKGLYDGKDILLITTEVSDKIMKDQIGNFTGYPVNYAANLTKSQDIGNLWIFKNGVKGPGLMGFQANVVDSIPGDSKYTPLWRVSVVEWKNTTTGSNATTTPSILGSDDAIAKAASKGQITITPTKVVVNCPIVQWGGNKDNTIPAGHI